MQMSGNGAPFLKTKSSVWAQINEYIYTLPRTVYQSSSLLIFVAGLWFVYCFRCRSDCLNQCIQRFEATSLDTFDKAFCGFCLLAHCQMIETNDADVYFIMRMRVKKYKMI